MTDYLKKFRLDQLTAFVVGGSGLIGKEICNSIVSAGGRAIVLDKIKYQINAGIMCMHYVHYNWTKKVNTSKSNPNQKTLQGQKMKIERKTLKAKKVR